MNWAKRNWRWTLAGGLAVSAIALATVVLEPFDSGSTNEQGGDPVAAETDGVGEGIQVHGDWVIEVRNADGSMAERREFENALTSAGSQYLDLVLARTAT